MFASFEIHRNTDAARGRWHLFTVPKGHRDANLAEPCIATGDHTDCASTGRQGAIEREVFKGWALEVLMPGHGGVRPDFAPFLDGACARLYVANRLATFASLGDLNRAWRESDVGLRFPGTIVVEKGDAFTVEVLCERPVALRALIDRLDGAVALVRLGLNR